MACVRPMSYGTGCISRRTILSLAFIHILFFRIKALPCRLHAFLYVKLCNILAIILTTETSILYDRNSMLYSIIICTTLGVKQLFHHFNLKLRFDSDVFRRTSFSLDLILRELFYSLYSVRSKSILNDFFI